MERYIRSFVYDHEQNTRLIRPYFEKKPFPEEGMRLLNHITAAKLLWLERIVAMPVKTQPWPDWSPELLMEKAVKANDDWALFLARVRDQEIEKTIHFRDFKQKEHERKISTVMEQVLFHGAHHRGQVVLIFRQAGISPPVTDFIFSNLGN